MSQWYFEEKIEIIVSHKVSGVMATSSRAQLRLHAASVLAFPWF